VTGHRYRTIRQTHRGVDHDVDALGLHGGGVGDRVRSARDLFRRRSHLLGAGRKLLRRRRDFGGAAGDLREQRAQTCRHATG
jgi:hypothetical protein